MAQKLEMSCEQTFILLKAFILPKIAFKKKQKKTLFSKEPAEGPASPKEKVMITGDRTG